MLFNSWIFWVFLPVVLGVYYALRHRFRLQNLWLLGASYLFYGWWDWRFLGLIVISTVVDYVCGLLMDRRVPGTEPEGPYRHSQKARKWLLIASLGTNLGILGFFKYFNFFVENLTTLVNTVSPVALNTSTLHIILPIGISFYTFQTLSYTIDVYRGVLRPTRRFLEFALFVTFFPQLVAGPIVRATTLLPQIHRPRRPTVTEWRAGAYLILWGLFKKVVIADNIAHFADQVFATDYGALEARMVFWGTWAFFWQIYCDFSGYSDIARGCAKLLGFEFDLNFNIPYAARNIYEFFNRWHISLSTWFRDYVLRPLGGMRGGTWRAQFNVLLTMVLTGLWHGASWNFVLWGLYCAGLGYLSVFCRRAARLSPFLFRLSRKRWWGVVKWAAFMPQLLPGFLIFRAQSLDQIIAMFAALGNGWAGFWHIEGISEILVFPGLLIAMQVTQYVRRDLDWVLKTPAPVRGFVYALMLTGIILYGNFAGNEFIYFQF